MTLKLALALALAVTCVITVTFAGNVRAEISEARVLDDVRSLDAPRFIDTRNAMTCAKNSINGALCIDRSQLVYPSGELASFRDINWLFDTFGLEITSIVVIFGDDNIDVDFLAGVLFLKNQSRIVLWRGNVDELVSSYPGSPGIARGLLRKHYTRQPIRDEAIALDVDLPVFFETSGVGRLTSQDPGESSHDLSVSLYVNANSDHLVLARTPVLAISHFARLVLRDPGVSLRVHVDGMRDRSPENFGAPEADSNLRTFLITLAGMAMLLGLFHLIVRRRRFAV